MVPAGSTGLLAAGGVLALGIGVAGGVVLLGVGGTGSVGVVVGVGDDG